MVALHISSNSQFLPTKYSVETRNAVHRDPLDVRHHVRTLSILCEKQRFVARHRCVDFAFRDNGIHSPRPVRTGACFPMATHRSHSNRQDVADRIQIRLIL